jgi:hypothetical protein
LRPNEKTTPELRRGTTKTFAASSPSNAVNPITTADDLNPAALNPFPTVVTLIATANDLIVTVGSQLAIAAGLNPVAAGLDAAADGLDVHPRSLHDISCGHELDFPLEPSPVLRTSCPTPASEEHFMEDPFRPSGNGRIRGLRRGLR